MNKPDNVNAENVTVLPASGSASLTEVLAHYGVPMSARRANKILLDRGIILNLYRKSMMPPYHDRSFKVLSRKGLMFGYNERSPVHPLETNIRYRIEDCEKLVFELMMPSEPFFEQRCG